MPMVQFKHRPIADADVFKTTVCCIGCYKKVIYAHHEQKGLYNILLNMLRRLIIIMEKKLKRKKED